MTILDPSIAGVPAAVLNHPAMMSVAERCTLYHLARDHFSGAGVIVDAGLFLGASTIAFCEALRSRPELIAAIGSRRPIQSYDIAIWVKSMNNHLRNKAVASVLAGREHPQPGDSFADLLLSLLSSCVDLADIRIGDVRDTFSCDRSIEIAFYDCLKTTDLDAAIYRKAAPYYRPGTVIVHQDYFYDRAIGLKIRQELLAEYFDFSGHVGASGIFVMTLPLPESLIVEDPVRKVSDVDKVVLLRQAANRTTDPVYRGYTLLALTDHHRMTGNKRQALESIEEVRAGIGHDESRNTARLRRRMDELLRQLAAA